MGLTLPLLSSILVLLLAFLFAPQQLLGETLGRKLEIWRHSRKILFFQTYLPVTDVHPQLASLQHVVQGMQGQMGQFSSAQRLDKVIDLVDDFGWNHGWLMNVGDTKGQIMDDALKLRLSQGDIKVALELGTFMGYSTLRLARQLANSSVTPQIITVDPDIMAFAVAGSIYQQAGVRDRITMKTDFSQNVFRKLKEEGKEIDFLFIDHVKHLYLPDLKVALELQILAKGCVVVGDNVVFPGAPDYKDYMLSGEGSKLFKTQVHKTHVEYWPDQPDEVLVSTFLR